MFLGCECNAVYEQPIWKQPKQSTSKSNGEIISSGKTTVIQFGYHTIISHLCGHWGRRGEERGGRWRFAFE
jgi:hypothetical protein